MNSIKGNFEGGVVAIAATWVMAFWFKVRECNAGDGFTFDFFILDGGAAVRRLFNVRAFAGLLVDDTPACWNGAIKEKEEKMALFTICTEHVLIVRKRMEKRRTCLETNNELKI